jgi:putative transferase (TIGR04331 family)
MHRKKLGYMTDNQFSYCNKYHWDDRKKLSDDFEKIGNISHKILVQLHKNLNTYHKVNYDELYWKRLIGVWLDSFVTICFDRWESVEINGLKESLNIQAIISERDGVQIPNCLSEFINLRDEDQWNNSIYLAAFAWKTGKIASISAKKFNILEQIEREIKAVEIYIKNKIRLLSNYVCRIKTNTTLFYINTYIRKAELVKLSAIRGERYVRWRCLQEPIVRPNNNTFRLANHVDTSSTSDVEDFILFMVVHFIPTSYLEGYKKLRYMKSGWPKNPRIVFTSTQHRLSDVFNQWAASVTSSGATKIVIAQHGGYYGMHSFSQEVDHEVAISDGFISWGWESAKYGNRISPLGVTKLGALQPIDKHFDNSQVNKILIIVNTHPKYAYKIEAIPIVHQTIVSIDQQIEFHHHLDSNLKDVVFIRLPPWKDCWGIKDKWISYAPSIKHDKLIFIDSMNESDIIVITSNTTALIEAMALDRPLIILWDEQLWEMNEITKMIFDEFREVGIYFTSAQDAAAHINNIASNVNSWWNSTEVSNARELFKKTYCKINKDIIRDLNSLFEKLEHSKID